MRVGKSVLLIITLILLVLLTLRWLGEQQFKAEPETIPLTTVDETTPLFQAVSHKLATARAAQTDSLFIPLGNAHLALLARIQLTEQAQQSLDLQYYLFHDDDTGHALLAAAVAAAERGVKVRLLIDDMDTAGREDVLIRLAAEQANLTIRVFNPVYTRSLRALDYLARFPRSSRRMHNKSFNADGVAAVVGGRNIGNEYFDVNAETGFIDFDVLAAGAVARAVTEEFDSYWYSGIAVDIAALGQAADDPRYQSWQAALQKPLATFRKQMQTPGGVPAINELLAVSRENVRTYYSNHEVIYDAPHKVLSGLFDTGDWLAPQILQLLASAQQELLIISPYFIPGERGTGLFKSLVDKGVSVTILTNSFAANDVVAVHSGYIDYRRTLLEAGVRLYELKATNDAQRDFSLLGSGRSSLHAKTFLIDRERSFVGSFNLDPRSAVHNTEMGVVFSNADYGAHVTEQFQQLLAVKAYQVDITADGNLQWTETVTQEGKRVQRVHDTEPDTTFWQRTLIKMLSWLPVEWLL
jgi:putative cardiolipin synthase